MCAVPTLLVQHALENARETTLVVTLAHATEISLYNYTSATIRCHSHRFGELIFEDPWEFNRYTDVQRETRSDVRVFTTLTIFTPPSPSPNWHGKKTIKLQLIPPKITPDPWPTAPRHAMEPTILPRSIMTIIAPAADNKMLLEQVAVEVEGLQK